MSICADCPYPYERMLEDNLDAEDEYICDGCSFEDAVYCAQWAYRQLSKRYETLLKEYNLLKENNKGV